MSQAFLQYSPVIILWAAVTYKTPSLRRNPRDPSLRGYWLTLLTLALALTVLVPPVYLTIDRMSGVPNLARLIANGLGLTTALAVQAFLFYLSQPEAVARRAVRRHGVALAGSLALMTVFFIVAPVDQEAVDFTRHYGDAPFILEYRLVFLSYLGLAAANVTRLSWRYAKMANRPSLSLGLRFVASGGLVGLMYVMHEGLFVTSRRFDIAYPIPGPQIVTMVLVAAGAALTVIGSTMPAWGPYLGIPRLHRWGGNYRSLRRLYPLWRDLYLASPGIALFPPSPRLIEMLTLRDLGFRLYRRTVEIRDGRLALRPHFDSRVVAAVYQRCHEAGLGDEETEATIEAASLAVAMRAKATGRTPEAAGPAPAPPGGKDVVTEVAALEHVARCYARSPIVREMLSRLERDEAETTTSGVRMAGGS